MPYVVIEAAAAGVPMIAANVGGIPEIFGPDHRTRLFAAEQSRRAWRRRSPPRWTIPLPRRTAPGGLRERIFQHFSQNAMVEGVLAGYREAFSRRVNSAVALTHFLRLCPLNANAGHFAVARRTCAPGASNGSVTWSRSAHAR